VADARKGEMPARYPIVFIGRHLEYPKALFGGRLWVCIKGTPEQGIRKLERSHQHEIPHHNECLPVALDDIGRMAGSVPMGCNRSDARRKYNIFLDALEFASLDVRCEQAR
jgi:hypothetical protein